MQKKVSAVTEFFMVVFTVAFLFSNLSFGKGDQWTTDMKKAMEKAVKEKKDLLVDFTGSDWCGWCIKLDDEVFSKEAFKKEAPKHFVLVYLDFPRKTKLDPELKKQNDEWMKKLGVSGFPTIYLLDAKGRPYAKTGYQAGGPESYNKHLAELRKVRIKRDKALEKADAAKGVKKAKLLDEAISKMDPAVIFSSYKKIVDQIVKLDSKNKAGLKNKYTGLKINTEVMQLIQKRDSDGAIKLIDQAFKDLKPEGELAQDLYFAKSQALFGKRDLEGAEKAINAALKAAPDGKNAGQIKRIIGMYFTPVMKKFNAVNEAIQTGEPDKALKLAEAAIKEMKPEGEDSHVLYFAKGLALMRKEDKKGARKAFEKALKDAPKGKYARYIDNMLKTQLKK